MALMYLAAAWAPKASVHLQAATVDHGLRSGSAEEAECVAQVASELSLPHAVLTWRGWDGSGNLQEAAREARRRLLSEWAKQEKLSAVLLGHTLDDQAETFLLRLGRGSGVDGLAAMAVLSETDEVHWLRPLLKVSRAELRDWLQARGIVWNEDPYNDDDTFARVRLRKAAGVLAELGLGPERLSATAAAMARARTALLARARDQARSLAEVSHGVLHFDCAGLSALEEETRLRLVAHGLQWTSNAPYRPRLRSLEAVLSKALDGHSSTLHGCLLCRHNDRLYIAREYAAVADHVVAAGDVWDERWHIALEGQDALIAPLGEAGLHVLETRPEDLPRAALLTLPSLWAQEELIAVPALAWGLSAQIYTMPDKTSFLASLIPH